MYLAFQRALPTDGRRMDRTSKVMFLALAESPPFKNTTPKVYGSLDSGAVKLGPSSHPITANKLHDYITRVRPRPLMVSCMVPTGKSARNPKGTAHVRVCTVCPPVRVHGGSTFEVVPPTTDANRQTDGTGADMGSAHWGPCLHALVP